MDIPDKKKKELIKEILDMEWEMFADVKSLNGRPSCQDDSKTFMIMRRAQADIWGVDTLNSYLNDLKEAKGGKANLMAVKYARMMEVTFPEEYENLKKRLPEVPARCRELVQEIVNYHLKWSIEVSDRFPKFFSLGRPISGEVNRSNSIENYLKSELLTYSENTLEMCLKDTIEAAENDINFSLEILKNTAISYGYNSLDEIEEKLSGDK